MAHKRKVSPVSGFRFFFRSDLLLQEVALNAKAAKAQADAAKAQADAAKAHEDAAGAPMEVELPPPVPKAAEASVAPEMISSEAWKRGVEHCNLQVFLFYFWRSGAIYLTAIICRSASTADTAAETAISFISVTATGAHI